MRLQDKWTESSKINFWDLFFLTLSLEIFHFYLRKGLWTHLTQFCICQRHGWLLVASHVTRLMPPAHSEQGSMLMQSRSSQRIIVSMGFAKAKYSQLPLLDLGAALQSENNHYDPPSCRIIPYSTPPPPQIPSKYSLTVYTSKLIWPLFLRERTQVCSFSTACLPYLGLPGETDSRNGHLNKRSPVACVPTP